MKINTDHIVDRVTEEEILKRTTEYDIYSHYMPKSFVIGRIMSSPFRDDKHPSFGIFKSSKTGSLLFKDQATGDVGNCFKFVSLLYKIKYHDTLQKIWEEVVTRNVVTAKGMEIRDYYKNRKAIISIKRKNFTKTDEAYWRQFHIDKQLLAQYEVFPISEFWVGEYKGSFKYSAESPMYAYKIFNSFKIYRPYSELKKDKWRSNCAQYDIQGWKQLPESGRLLVITKSLKDIMVLSLLGIPAIAPHAENTLVPNKVIEKARERFDRIIVLYDYDEGGISGSEKMHEKYGFDCKFIPKHYLEIHGVKDVSDFIKTFGKKDTKELLKELLNESIL